jgi:hypothetical protein
VTKAAEVGATVAVATAADAPFATYGRTSVEVAAGPTIGFAPTWLGFAVAGAGVRDGYGTPDWRVLLGVRMTRGGAAARAEDEDLDGVLAGDLCPRAAEDADGFKDGDGCPDGDNDGDGVPDASDGAPLEPEDRDQYADEDGVPDPDNDGDGRADAADACPSEGETVNGFEDEDGCPDVGDGDQDGRRDDVDQCVAEAEDADGFQDEDGCPDADNDGDGLADPRDRCPNEVGPAENYGCPDTDEDGDGVAYRVDVCPKQAGTVGFDGCKTKPRVTLRDGKVVIIEPVFFTTGSNLSAKPLWIASQNPQSDTSACRRDWPGRKRRCPAGPGALGGSGGGGGGEGWLRVSAGGRGGARQKGTSKASRSSVPRSQASARSAGPGLCQWARIMAPGGYSAMTTTGLSAGRWRTRLAALR